MKRRLECQNDHFDKLASLIVTTVYPIKVSKVSNLKKKIQVQCDGMVEHASLY